MSADEFERDYAARSNLSVATLRRWGRVVVPCRCGNPSCVGWASMSAENAATELKLGRITQEQFDEAVARLQ